MTENQRKKILVIDDEADMRLFVSTVLETSGYLPIVAENGEVGIVAARRESPSLIVLDVMMPNIEDGIRTYQQFKTDTVLKHIPIVMLSAIARKTFFHAISRLHFGEEDTPPDPEAYMEKPPDANELALLVSKVLGDRNPGIEGPTLASP